MVNRPYFQRIEKPWAITDGPASDAEPAADRPR
jgi:hypothetical protein